MPLSIPLWAYVLVSTLLCTGISGGINTAISYALYAGKEAETLLFAFPSTVAGDVILTCMIGSIVTWLISGQLALGDLADSGPLRITTGLPWKSADELPRFLQTLAVASYQPILERTKGQDAEKAARTNPVRNFVYCAATGAVVGLVFLVPTLGLTFILAGYFAVEHNADDGDIIWDMPTLLLYKGLLGALMGLVEQPLIVLLIATKPVPADKMEEEDEECGSSDSKPTETATETPAQQ